MRQKWFRDLLQQLGATTLPQAIQQHRRAAAQAVPAGDYQEALGALLGDKAKGWSANTISRLKQHWGDEHGEWSQRDLSQKRYAYFWADGIYSWETGFACWLSLA